MHCFGRTRRQAVCEHHSVQIAGPLRDHNRRNPVADYVSQRPRLGHKPVDAFIEKSSELLVAVVGIIMRAAPIGAMAFTIGAYGLQSLLALAKPAEDREYSQAGARLVAPFVSRSEVRRAQPKVRKRVSFR
jgi:hypothetical protein